MTIAKLTMVTVIATIAYLMIGGLYSTDSIETSPWYYNIANVAKIFYADTLAPIHFSDTVSLTLGDSSADKTTAPTAQPIAKWAKIGGTLYGAMAELTIAGLILGAA